MHSDILNYTKLAFNSLKIIQNDSLSANQTGDDRPVSALTPYFRNVPLLHIMAIVEIHDQSELRKT